MNVAFATEVWCSASTNPMKPPDERDAGGDPVAAGVAEGADQAAAVAQRDDQGQRERERERAEQHDLPGACGLDQADQQTADAPEHAGERHQHDAPGIVRVDVRADLRRAIGGADRRLGSQRSMRGRGVIHRHDTSQARRPCP